MAINRIPIRMLVPVALALTVVAIFQLNPWLSDLIVEIKYTPLLNQSTTVKDDLHELTTALDSVVSVNQDEGCQKCKEQFRKAYPSGTDPNDGAPMIHIASASEIQPGLYSWMAEGTKAFAHCDNLMPWMQCSYSMNSSQSYLERSNAVLFHARFMSNKPPAVYELPKVRPLNQKWVFFESEAPTNTWNYVSTNETYWKLFNITVTYTSDSDIPLEYHRMKCLPKENWSTKTLNHAAKKTKFSAWFVSHCKTSSRRELYVKELQKYISVDIYGSCSNSSKCLRNSQDVSEQENCMMDVINSDYKFYLSFENSFCSEYVTEKFNRIVRFGNVIPIVLGSADYGKIIPRGTYIDVRDFGSPKELADYLHTVANDDGLYNEYINRKKRYVCRIKRSFNCNLCEYLHKHRYEKEVVYDAARFWSTRFRCTSPKDFYRDVAPDLAKKIEFSRSPEVFL